MASLQVRHTRTCAIGKPWTPAARERMDGCTCAPTYYVVVREGRKLHRERAGKNRQTAERALRKIGTQVDDGVYQPQKRKTFAAWADEWLDGLERKAATVRGYRSTVAYATKAFGHKQVRQIGVDDLRELLATMRVDGISASTRAKHLRVLGACFSSASESGYAARNPARQLPKDARPRPAKKESAYFEADELKRLFVKVEPGVYRVLFLVALKTGMRLGELLALTWAELDLVEAVIRVRRSYSDGSLGTTKNHELRDVDVTDELVELLGEWWGELGRPEDDRLVFPGPTKSGYLNTKTIAAELYAAMAAAGVPRVGATGAKRTFHSLRHTHAKVALENGRSITWLQRRLGHQSIFITIGTYGHWEREARREEARKLAGAFGV
jgi:integrase